VQGLEALTGVYKKKIDFTTQTLKAQLPRLIQAVYLENVAIKADPARHFQVSPKEHMPSVYKAMVMVGLEDGGHSDLDAKEAWALRVKLGPVQTVLCLSAEYYQALKKQFKKDKTKANMRQAVNLKAKLYMKLHAKVTGASGCPAMTDMEVPQQTHIQL
jgi:hypothetical protein